MDVTLRAVAQAEGKPILSSLKKEKDGFSRGDVVNAFQEAFQIMGGVKRLALWGNENPGDFFRLYAKLLPATSLQLGDNNQVTIIHAIPPTALDNHKGYEGAIEVVVRDPEAERADNQS
jgi:hypothetical protein